MGIIYNRKGCISKTPWSLPLIQQLPFKRTTSHQRSRRQQLTSRNIRFLKNIGLKIKNPGGN